MPASVAGGQAQVDGNRVKEGIDTNGRLTAAETFGKGGAHFVRADSNGELLQAISSHAYLDGHAKIGFDSDDVNILTTDNDAGILTVPAAAVRVYDVAVQRKGTHWIPVTGGTIARSNQFKKYDIAVDGVTKIQSLNIGAVTKKVLEVLDYDENNWALVQISLSKLGEL